MNNNVTSAGNETDSRTKDELLPSAPLAANPVLAAVLPLTLTKKWFDMINAGVKLEEYREIKSYWFSRLVFQHLDVIKYVGIRDAKVNEDIIRLCNDAFWSKTFCFKPFDFVEFTNGYSKNAPKIKVECKGIQINTGKSEWGAVNDQKYFVIKLGTVTA
jgi:hypothetical protein